MFMGGDLLPEWSIHLQYPQLSIRAPRCGRSRVVNSFAALQTNESINLSAALRTLRSIEFVCNIAALRTLRNCQFVRSAVDTLDFPITLQRRGRSRHLEAA
jgi:hypothetical protein